MPSYSNLNDLLNVLDTAFKAYCEHYNELPGHHAFRHDRDSGFINCIFYEDFAHGMGVLVDVYIHIRPRWANEEKSEWSHNAYCTIEVSEMVQIEPDIDRESSLLCLKQDFGLTTVEEVVSWLSHAIPAVHNLRKQNKTTSS